MLKILQLLQKSVITPDFEKKECVPPYRESLHQLKKQRRVSEELIMPQITTQALGESPCSGCVHTLEVVQFNVFLSRPVKSTDSEVKVLRWYKSVINNLIIMAIKNTS